MAVYLLVTATRTTDRAADYIRTFKRRYFRYFATEIQYSGALETLNIPASASFFPPGALPILSVNS